MVKDVMNSVYAVIGVLSPSSACIVGIFNNRESMCDSLSEYFSKCYMQINGKRVEVSPILIGVYMRNKYCVLYSNSSGCELYKIYKITLNKVNPELDENIFKR